MRSALIFAGAISLLAPSLASAQTNDPFATPDDGAPAPAPAPAPVPPPPPAAVPAYPAAPPPLQPIARNEARSARNVVVAEGLGAGLFYSLNYERYLTDDVALRVGFGVTRFTDPDFSDIRYTLVAIPLLVSFTGVDNARRGNGAHHLNLSGGITVIYASETVDDTFTNQGSGVLGVIELGYRYQPRDGGFMFRTGPQLLVGGGISQVWWAIALGAAF